MYAQTNIIISSNSSVLASNCIGLLIDIRAISLAKFSSLTPIFSTTNDHNIIIIDSVK